MKVGKRDSLGSFLPSVSNYFPCNCNYRKMTISEVAKMENKMLFVMEDKGQSRIFNWIGFFSL